MSFFYHSFIFNPLYNTLIAMFAFIPWIDAGIAVVFLTIIVRLILYPLSKKAVLTQVRMQEISPKIAEIKEKYKNNSQEQATQTLALYREKGVNPFSGFFVLIIQLPIIWALYKIFLLEGFPTINTEILYFFIPTPENINLIFLGLMNIMNKSAVLAFLAAITTFFQLKIAISYQTLPKEGSNSFGDHLARSMQVQMKYIFPVIVFFISYKISGVIALYWFTSNIFTIGQEIVVRKKLAVAQLTK